MSFCFFWAMILDCSSVSFGAIQKQNSAGFKNRPVNVYIKNVSESIKLLWTITFSYTDVPPTLIFHTDLMSKSQLHICLVWINIMSRDSFLYIKQPTNLMHTCTLCRNTSVTNRHMYYVLTRIDQDHRIKSSFFSVQLLNDFKLVPS